MYNKMNFKISVITFYFFTIKISTSTVRAEFYRNLIVLSNHQLDKFNSLLTGKQAGTGNVAKHHEDDNDEILQTRNGKFPGSGTLNVIPTDLGQVRRVMSRRGLFDSLDIADLLNKGEQNKFSRKKANQRLTGMKMEAKFSDLSSWNSGKFIGAGDLTGGDIKNVIFPNLKWNPAGDTDEWWWQGSETNDDELDEW